jgi:hypothetical protein
MDTSTIVGIVLTVFAFTGWVASNVLTVAVDTANAVNTHNQAILTAIGQ